MLDSSSCSDKQANSNSNLKKTNVITRKGCKRTEDGKNTDLLVQISEMKQMFLDFKNQQEQKFDKLHSAFEAIIKQNSEIRSSIDYQSASYVSLKEQINTLESDRQNTLLYVKELEDKLDKFETAGRSTCIEIRSIPVQTQESKEMLLKTIISIGSVLGMPIQPHHIRDIFRIKGKDQESRPIIVDFTSVLMKENLIYMYKKFNKEKSKLTTASVKIQGPCKPVFISENLSAKMKRLFFLCRDFAKINSYKYCWVSKGKLFLRKADSSSVYLIKTENDLHGLKTAT